MTTKPRPCPHDGSPCRVLELEDRIEVLEAETTKLRHERDQMVKLFSALPGALGHSQTLIYVTAKRGPDLQIGDFFVWTVEPGDEQVTATKAPAAAEDLDGVVVTLSVPGQVGYCPCTSIYKERRHEPSHGNDR